MNILGKRTTNESEEIKKVLMKKMLSEEIDHNKAISIYAGFLKPSILESYIEPILLVLAFGFTLFGLFLLVFSIFIYI